MIGTPAFLSPRTRGPAVALTERPRRRHRSASSARDGRADATAFEQGRPGSRSEEFQRIPVRSVSTGPPRPRPWVIRPGISMPASWAVEFVSRNQGSLLRQGGNLIWQHAPDAVIAFSTSSLDCDEPAARWITAPWAAALSVHPARRRPRLRPLVSRRLVPVNDFSTERFRIEKNEGGSCVRYVLPVPPRRLSIRRNRAGCAVQGGWTAAVLHPCNTQERNVKDHMK